jgi:hypothetical protein
MNTKIFAMAALGTILGLAQARIPVPIYTPRSGHGGHSFWQMNWGQNQLAQVADETGGESYMLGFGPQVSFQPYLREIAEHLTHQYTAGFAIATLHRPGLVPVRFATEVPNAEIVGATKVFVAPAAPTGEDR